MKDAREAFEAWVRDTYGEHPGAAISYATETVADHWLGRQARRALLSQPAAQPSQRKARAFVAMLVAEAAK